MLDENRADREHGSPRLWAIIGDRRAQNLGAYRRVRGSATDLAAISDDNCARLAQIGGRQSELLGVFSGENCAGGARVHDAREVDLWAALSLGTHVQGRHLIRVVWEPPLRHWIAGLPGEETRRRNVEEGDFGGSIFELVPELLDCVSDGQEFAGTQSDPLPPVIERLVRNRGHG
jgi:hypothetical protein